MWQRVWIWKRKLKKGATYCLRWHDEQGRIRTETVGPDRKLAERLCYKRELDLNAGKLRNVRKISYEDFKNEDLAAMKGRMAKKSLEDLEQTLEGFQKMFEITFLTDATAGVLEKYVSRRLEQVSVATVNKNLRTFKAAFNRAARRGYLEKGLFSELKPIREPERELRILSSKEIKQLLVACGSIRWKALIGLAVTTGMRLGEMLALCWDDVDLQACTIAIRNTAEHSTKSRRNRVVVLLPSVRKLLLRLDRKGSLVFHTQDGAPWRYNVQRDFNRIVKRSGIKRCTLHDLRRTFVSHLAMAGVNEAVVQKLAGHSSISTTLDYYTRILPEAMRSAQARLPFIKVFEDISDTYHGPDDGAERKTA